MNEKTSQQKIYLVESWRHSVDVVEMEVVRETQKTFFTSEGRVLKDDLHVFFSLYDALKERHRRLTSILENVKEQLQQAEINVARDRTPRMAAVSEEFIFKDE